MKKWIQFTAAAIMGFSSVSMAANIVPCETFLHETIYSHAVDHINHESFFIVRKIKNGISNEKYIFSNGKVIHGQSRAVAGQPYCGSYAKHFGHEVQYAYSKIYGFHDYYAVHVYYKNGDRQRFKVYPFTKGQFEKALGK